MKLLYPASFYPCEDKPGAYTVTVPDLPGCISEGDTLEEALVMATDAASGWVLDEIEDGHPLPPASEVTDIQTDSTDGFIKMLVLDMDTYAEKQKIESRHENLPGDSWF